PRPPGTRTRATSARRSSGSSTGRSRPWPHPTSRGCAGSRPTCPGPIPRRRTSAEPALLGPPMILATSILEDLFRGVLQGLPPGTVYALVALGFVLAYKTSGVFNLAFGAQAYVSAAMYFQARDVWGWGTVPAFVVSVLVLAPAIGLVLERLIFRHLPTSSAVAKLVVAIGLTVAMPSIFELLVGFQPVAGRTPEGIVPDGATVFYDPFGVYSFSRNELVAMFVALTATAGLAALFRFTDLG